MGSNLIAGTYPLSLGNFQKILKLISWEKARLNGYLYEFSIDFNTIDVSDIITIHKYLLKIIK